MSNVSRYSTSELPTWREIMDWYELPIRSYDPLTDSADLNMYWKIPKKQVLIALMCNQFNKMITEDGYRDNLLTLLSSSKYINIQPEDVAFMPFSQYMPPEPMEIYSFINPSGRPDIFRSSWPHKDIDDTSDPMELILFVKAKPQGWFPISHDLFKQLYDDIIKCMMEPYMEYFSRDRRSCNQQYHLGYDPAR